MSSTQHHQTITPHHVPPPIPPTSTPHIPHSSTGRQPASLQQPDTRLQTTEPDQMVRHQSESMSPDRHLQHSESNRQIQNGLQGSYQHSYPGGFTQQTGYNTSGQVKPYRPWGAEVAY